MAKVSKKGKGKTLYIKLSIYPCGNANPTKNLTISCPDKDTRFKTTLSDRGLKKFKQAILKFYEKKIMNSVLVFCFNSFFSRYVILQYVRVSCFV